MLVSPVYSGATVIRIEKDCLAFQTKGEIYSLNFALIVKIRAVNFRVLLTTADGDFEISQLGYDFEGFYETLYRAFCDRSQEALFVGNVPLMEAAGEFAYLDVLGEGQGTALLRLFEDCLTILPADDGGRRVPLCFVQEITRENFTVRIVLDTGERYELLRLGRKTEAFFDLLTTCRQKAKSRYEADLAAIEKNGKEDSPEIGTRYRTLTALCGEDQVFCGVFAPVAETAEKETKDKERALSFWFVGLQVDRAAVELSTGEKTATYLYRFTGNPKDFLHQLHHAMEAVKDHREVIYLEEISPKTSPLYTMAVVRSGALCFLRKAMAGRLIHNESWQERIAAFFK